MTGIAATRTGRGQIPSLELIWPPFPSRYSLWETSFSC